MSDIIQDRKLYNKLFEKAKKAPWTCMAPTCRERCINSHVLQKNGILSEISSHQHVIEVKPTNIWELDKIGTFKYQEIGVNEAFTFPGFCSIHDNGIFKPIETDNLDFDNYKIQCLFSYRGLCQEIRRKEQVKLFINYLLEQREQFSVMQIHELFEDYRDGLILGVENLTYFKTQLEDDLQNSTENFLFKTLRRPRVEICTSAPINIKEPNEPEPTTYEEYKERVRKIIPTTFVNIFPTGTQSQWIIGEHKQYRSSYTSHLLQRDYELALSELLILRMEYWCMSSAFLKRYITPKDKEIRAVFMRNVLNFEADLQTSINLLR